MARIIQPLKKITHRAQDLINRLMDDPDEEQMIYFDSIIKEFREAIALYTNFFPEFIEQTRAKITRTAFAQSGDCVHRGIHCPSPVLSLLVGCNGGFIIESAEQATANYFKYSFDAEDNLIAISHYDYGKSPLIPDEIEFIFKREDTEYGITYNNGWNEITRVSKVVFQENRQLKYYAVSEYDESEPELMFLHYEEYKYENNFPVRAQVYFGISPELGMYEKHTFLLSRDSDSDHDHSIYFDRATSSIRREA